MKVTKIKPADHRALAGGTVTPTMTLRWRRLFEVALAALTGLVLSVLSASAAATNTPPTITAPTNFTAIEDVTMAVTGITVADVDAGTNALELTLTVSSGRLFSTAWSRITFTQTNSGSLSITGSVADLNSHLGSNAVTFVTETNSTNFVVLGITINDLGYSNGPPEIRTEFVPVQVTPAVDPPVQNVPPHGFSNNVSTIIGFGTTEGRFRAPGPLATDALGNLYAVDQHYRQRVINRFSARGDYIATFGTPGTNTGQLSSAESIAVDNQSRVYVGDIVRQRVLIYGTNGVFQEEWGESGTNTHQIGAIGELAFDSANQLYMLDLPRHVKKFTTNGTFIAAWGSNGTVHSSFHYPWGLAVSPDGSVLVSEYYHGLIHVFETNGTLRTSLGLPGSTNGLFGAPTALAVDSSGTIFVSDLGLSKIHRLDAAGRLLASWGSFGTEPGEFGRAFHLATDPDGFVYVSEDIPGRIQKFSPATYLTRPNETIPLTGLSVTSVDGTIVSTELSLTNGSFTMDLSGGAWTASPATNVTSLTVTGSTAQINAALATVIYSPATNSVGFDALTWISTDNASVKSTNVVRIGHHQNLPLANQVPTNTPTTSIISDLLLTNVLGVTDPDAGTNLIRVTLKSGFRDFMEFNNSLTNDINDSPRGTFTLATTNGLTFLTGDGTTDNHVSFRGTLADISNALAVVTYSPSIFLVGNDLVQMIAEDTASHCCGIQRDADFFTIQITNSLPRVTRVEAVDPSGIYGIGSNLIFRVYFDQMVMATYDGTNPYVRLTLDGGTVNAPLFGQVSNAAMFVYTVRDGDSATAIDYDGANALVVSTNTFIRSLLSDAAILTLPVPGSSNSLAGSAAWTIDGIRPTWNSITVPTNGAYTPGRDLEFVLEASEPLFVATNTTGPRLSLMIGENNRFATLVRGAGSNVLTFRYTIQADDRDPDGIELNSTLDLNGTFFFDRANNSISPALPSFGSTSDIVVGSQPFVTSVRGMNAGNHYGIGASIFIEVDFNQVVVAGYDGTNPSVRLRLDSGTATAPLTFQSTNFAIFEYTIREGDVAAVLDYDGTNALVVGNGSFLRGLGGIDADLTLPPPGSSNSIAGGDTFVIDGIRPTWTSLVLPTNGLYRIGDVLSFELEASETLYLDTNSTVPRLTLTLDSGTVHARFVNGYQSNRIRFAYTLQSGDRALNGIALGTTIDFNGSPIYDRAANHTTNALPTFGSTAGIIVDAAPPRLSYGVLFDPPSTTQKIGDVLHLGVSVSKPVTVNTNLGLPSMELFLSSGLVHATYASNHFQALHFTYTIQPGDLSPTNTAYIGDTLHLNGAVIRDALNYDLITSLLHTSALHILEIDGVVPSLTNSIPPADGVYGLGQHLDFIIGFDEPVTNSGNPRIEMTIGSATRFANFHSGSGSNLLTFRYTVQSGDVDLDGIAVSSSLNLTNGTVLDLAGNAIANETGSSLAFPGITITNPATLGNVRGTYHGLFYETNEVRHHSSGAFLIKATDLGAYSGTLQLAGNKHRFAGTFNPQRLATNSISRKGLPSLTVTLGFDHRQPPRALHGRVTDGNWTAVLFGTPLDFHARTNPAPTAGRYTLIFPGTDNDPALPAGDGYGVLTIDAAGKLKLTGALADGTKLSHGSVVNADALWPFYVPLYKKSGSVIGWLSFTNDPDSTPAGLISWIKPTQTTGAHYRHGFTNETSVVGSRYLAPGKGTNILSWTNGVALALGGNLPATLTNTFVIGASHAVTLAPGNITKLKWSAKDGRFSGSLRHPATGKSTPFNGVLLQSLDEGTGFFLGTNQSGRIQLLP